MNSRRVWAGVVLLGLSSTINAGTWTVIDETPGAESYVDLTSVRVKDGYTQIWAMRNNVNRKTKAKTSAKALYEFDCEKRMINSVYYVVYMGHNGAGDLSGDQGYLQPNWQPVIPHTFGDSLYGFACTSTP